MLQATICATWDFESVRKVKVKKLSEEGKVFWAYESSFADLTNQPALDDPAPDDSQACNLHEITNQIPAEIVPHGNPATVLIGYDYFDDDGVDNFVFAAQAADSQEKTCSAAATNSYHGHRDGNPTPGSIERSRDAFDSDLSPQTKPGPILLSRSLGATDVCSWILLQIFVILPLQTSLCYKSFLISISKKTANTALSVAPSSNPAKPIKPVDQYEKGCGDSRGEMNGSKSPRNQFYQSNISSFSACSQPVRNKIPSLVVLASNASPNNLIPVQVQILALIGGNQTNNGPVLNWRM